LTGASEEQQYPQREKAFYADAATVEFARPGRGIRRQPQQPRSSVRFGSGLHTEHLRPISRDGSCGVCHGTEAAFDATQFHAGNESDLLRVEEEKMRVMKIVVPSAIALAGLLVCTSSMFGTPEYAKKEKKACTTCHSKISTDKAEMVKNLNTTGMCYKDNDHSLEKCATKK
jgi:hypothetical protein